MIAASELSSLAQEQRHIIMPSTEILGGILLTRAAIVVDVDENPELYRGVINAVDESMRTQQQAFGVSSTADIVETLSRTVSVFVPFNSIHYSQILRDEARKRGKERIEQTDQIGLSRFIGNAGICQQHALLSATVLRLMQVRGDFDGKVKVIHSVYSRFNDPDRHVAAVLTYDNEDHLISVG